MAKVVVIGRVFEAKIADVRQVVRKGLREAVAENLDVGRLFLFAYLFVLLLVGCSLEALPRKSAAEEVHKNMTQSLEIITTRLLAAKMRVDTHVTCSARQRLPLAVGNVLFRFGISVLLRHAEVDHVHDIAADGSMSAHEKVVGLDVAIDKVLFVNGLDSRELRRKVSCACLLDGCRLRKKKAHHLLGNHDHCFDRELPTAAVKQIFE